MKLFSTATGQSCTGYMYGGTARAGASSQLRCINGLQVGSRCAAHSRAVREQLGNEDLGLLDAVFEPILREVTNP